MVLVRCHAKKIRLIKKRKFTKNDQIVISEHVSVVWVGYM